MADKTPTIHDLDILRPPPEYVRLAGKKIDISFIPSGIAMDVMNLQGELQTLVDSPEKLERMKGGGEEARRSFEIAAELCAAITGCQHEEMTKEWLLKHTDVLQIKALMDHIVRAVYHSLETSEDEETKKQQAVGTASP